MYYIEKRQVSFVETCLFLSNHYKKDVFGFFCYEFEPLNFMSISSGKPIKSDLL